MISFRENCGEKLVSNGIQGSVRRMCLRIIGVHLNEKQLTADYVLVLHKVR